MGAGYPPTRTEFRCSCIIAGRLIVPSRFGQRYAYGLVEENGKKLIVTGGIGTSILPVRFRVPPEVVILTLIPQ